MDNKKKKVCYALALGASCVLISTSTCNYEYHPEYELLEDDLAYAKYSKGNVYIGDENFLKSISPAENDILILDDRVENENMKIINSYKVEDSETRNEILCIMEEYEKEYPSIWDRSIESMRLEWFVHNVFYDLHLRKSSTVDVDFENNEEALYGGKVFTKTFYK